MADDILIHLGLPKTGTTAIQRTLHAGSEQLAAAGFYYPPPLSDADPKHQSLVTGLMSNDHGFLKAALFSAPRHCKLIFSAEGLTNHLYDFPKTSLAQFRQCLSGWRTRGILVHRPWEDWVKSYFKQCIVNPPNRQFGHYGFFGTLDEFRCNERVRCYARLNNLLVDIGDRLGVERITVLDYSPAIRDEFLAYLGLEPGRLPRVAAANDSLSDVAAETIRQLNAWLRQGPERRLWLAEIAAQDGSNNAVANTVKAGDLAVRDRLDPALIRRLKWTAASGLAVSREDFDAFRKGLTARLACRSTLKPTREA